MGLLTPGKSHAEGGISPWDLRKKAEAKSESRWTLQEWMEQKNRNAIMDLWLAVHSPSPYEFYLGGSSNRSKLTTTLASVSSESNLAQSEKYQLGAFAERIGITGEYENITDLQQKELAGALNFRLAGNSVQGTHLILQAGVRTKTLEGFDQYQNPFASVDLNLYVTRYFGFEGLYRSYFTTEHSVLGSISGSLTYAGLILDFGPLRLYGRWLEDRESRTAKTTLSETKINRSGTAAGLMIFF